ncbi:unnamed protein product [Cyclocybe aegerita]|uniref:Uncharacterized protein n=1 Tax=Cyclocybe aegerita TaxID=1973307 RepID=A0A8S0WDC7_CYCAE|nr:unnamed protein product [Cyclocybe aegerita]
MHDLPADESANAEVHSSEMVTDVRDACFNRENAKKVQGTAEAPPNMIENAKGEDTKMNGVDAQPPPNTNATQTKTSEEGSDESKGARHDEDVSLDPHKSSSNEENAASQQESLEVAPLRKTRPSWAPKPLQKGNKDAEDAQMSLSKEKGTETKIDGDSMEVDSPDHTPIDDTVEAPKPETKNAPNAEESEVVALQGYPSANAEDRRQMEHTSIVDEAERRPEGKNDIEDAQMAGPTVDGPESVLEDAKLNCDRVKIDSAQPNNIVEKVKSGPKTPKTRQEFIEDIVIRFADSRKRHLSADASAKEKDRGRQKVLNDKETRHRLIFQQWPRAPKGEILRKENSEPGKMAPNGQQLWGASLLDFYIVRRIPDLMGLATFTTGSKMLAWVRKHGEDEFAKEFVRNAEKEPDPEKIEPYDIAKAIMEMEQALRTRMGKVDMEWHPTGSVFQPDAYPPGWSRGPLFENADPYVPSLRKYIPHTLLPSRLVVHDPWNVLTVAYKNRDWWNAKRKWSEEDDMTYIYKLSSNENTPSKKQDEKDRIAREEKRKKVLETFLADPHTRNELPDGVMVQTDNKSGHLSPIYIVFPPEPERTPPKEAHLYMMPSHRIGTGNHSHVFKARWELPRSFLVKEELCMTCVMDDMAEQLKEQEGDEAKSHGMCGVYVCKVESRPEVVTTMANEDGEEQQYILEEGHYSEKMVYEGSLRVILTRVKYQNLERGPYCAHIRKEERAIHPLTATVSVAAKLSIEDDYHLGREVKNYQGFPRHFWEHWSGYNLIHPIHDPVPIGPLAPQFYGYYVPDDDAMEEEAKLEAAHQVSQEQQISAATQDQNMEVGDGGRGNPDAAEADDQEKDDESPSLGAGEAKEQGDDSGMDVQKNGDGSADRDSGEVAMDASDEDVQDVQMADAAAEDCARCSEGSKSQNERPADQNTRDTVETPDGDREGEEKVEASKEGQEDQSNDDSMATKSDPVSKSPPAKPRVRPEYLSPILLIENCGQPIEPNLLTVDDKQECVSMVLRFHDAGYIHGSVARRNILRVPGPLAASASERVTNADNTGDHGVNWSYRLIDFGRSYNAETKSAEEVRREVVTEDMEVTNWLWGLDTLH